MRRSYVQRRAEKYRNYILFYLLLVIIVFIIVSIIIGIYKTITFTIFIIIPLSILLSKYKIWISGAKGEAKVKKTLSKLGKSYYIVHDIKLPREKGNIDHIVLGKNGIFVIETKNHKGHIESEGDNWIQIKTGRKGTTYIGKLGNPSKQVKWYALNLRKFIRKRLKQNIFVNSIVVFANRESELDLHNPTVSVLKVEKLLKFIKNYKSKRFTNKEFEGLKKLIRDLS